MRIPTFVYFLLCIALLAGTISVYREILAPATLEATVLIDGEAPVVLLRGPLGERILINAGKDAGVLRAIGAALPFWQRRLNAVIVTKVHRDSMGGLPDVMRRYQVGTVVRPKEEGTPSVERLIEDATRNIQVLKTSRGNRIRLSERVSLDVLSDAPLSLHFFSDSSEYVFK